MSLCPEPPSLTLGNESQTISTLRTELSTNTFSLRSQSRKASNQNLLTPLFKLFSCGAVIGQTLPELEGLVLVFLLGEDAVAIPEKHSNEELGTMLSRPCKVSKVDIFLSLN